MGWINDQCRKVCRIIDNFLANRPTERDPLIVAVQKAFDALEKQRWIPVSERLPEENHWLGGSVKQFSDEVLVNVVNYDDEDTWVYISQTINGRWTLELPRHCEITAWMPLPEPYQGGDKQK